MAAPAILLLSVDARRYRQADRINAFRCLRVQSLSDSNKFDVFLPPAPRPLPATVTRRFGGRPDNSNAGAARIGFCAFARYEPCRPILASLWHVARLRPLRYDRSGIKGAMSASRLRIGRPAASERANLRCRYHRDLRHAARRGSPGLSNLFARRPKLSEPRAMTASGASNRISAE